MLRALPPSFLMSTPNPYTPPPSLSRLSSYAPTHRLSLCMRPTPIEPFPLSNLHPDLSQKFHIKRDDQTGGPTSGNKIRKLEFLLAQAMSQRATTIITAGGVQSNHARSTAVAARRLGFDVHVFLRSRDMQADLKVADGNLLIHKMLGVGIHLVPPMGYESGLKERMLRFADELREKGERPFLIGIGGSDEIGLWGYLECFVELMQQGLADRFTDVVLAIGSGGSASGLSIANYLAGNVINMHAVTVCDNADYFYDHLDDMLARVGLSGQVAARQILNILEGKGRGYAKNTDEELKYGLQVARETGILLDPVYTLKAVKRMVEECQGKHGCFASDARILFIHTGGVFGLFDRRIEPFLDHSHTRIWPEQ